MFWKRSKNSSSDKSPEDSILGLKLSDAFELLVIVAAGVAGYAWGGFFHNWTNLLSVISVLAFSAIFLFLKQISRFRADGTTIKKIVEADGREIKQKLDHLREQSGFEALYSKSSEVSADNNPFYDVMTNAEEEILIYDTSLGVGGAEVTLQDEVLERTLSTYLDLVERGGNYHRVLQTNGESLDGKLETVDGAYAAHFSDVLQLGNHPRAGLTATNSTLSNMFTIVDGKYVILDIHKVTSKGDFEVVGELIIRDPTGKLVAVFKNLYEEAQADGTRLAK